jgi:hypothetical protein
MFVYNALMVASVPVVRSSVHNAQLDRMKETINVCHADQVMCLMLLELLFVVYANRVLSLSRETLLVVLALLGDSAQVLVHRLVRPVLSDLCSQTLVLPVVRSVEVECIITSLVAPIAPLVLLEHTLPSVEQQLVYHVLMAPMLPLQT